MRELEGQTVLIVEDNLLIAMDLVEVLESAGCAVVGPCPRIADALKNIAYKRIDAALLDVNLFENEKVFPLMDTLLAARVPCLIITGYSRNSIPPRYRKVPVLHKPHSREEVGEMLRRLLRSRRIRMGARGRAGPTLP
jgi:CheY-like chemotaxis protein